MAETPQATRDLIAAFQYRVIEELARRAVRAAEDEAAESIIVSGGVAANLGLRERFKRQAWPFYFPPLALTTDNAAMIGAAAYPRLARGETSPLDLRAAPSLALA